MKTLATITMLAGSAVLAGCVGYGSGHDVPPPRDTGVAHADLADAYGQDVGDVSFNEYDGGVRVLIQVRGMPPGTHGAHIHAVGDCTPPDFSGAGGHWNPRGRQHGRENPMGQHMGDMPNLIVGAGGTGTLELTIEGARLTAGRVPMIDDDGAAVVIHAGPDDYRSDPAGAAGPRIACGIVYPAM